MCFGYQSTARKFMTNAKISCPHFNIHKSKLIVVEWHYVKTSKTYNYLIFSTEQDNNSFKFYFLEGKASLGHQWILNCFT
jgi:hypothetical protein